MLEYSMAKRWDERDTIFSRIYELVEGSEPYSEYYRLNPERLETDRGLRRPGEGVYSGRHAEQRQIDAVFSLIADLRPMAGHEAVAAAAPESPGAERPESSPLKIDPGEAAGRIKKAAASFGAFSCGITETDEDWVYSVRGRGAHYGAPVTGYLPSAIVFAVEMDESEINRAPAVEQSVEVVRSYLLAAVAGIALKRVINAWGYRAVCHMDGMSEIILPPAAEAAGLGAIGLHGLLVTSECGPRVRLAAVTTDLPLLYDPPSAFKIRNACRNCGRCADKCPSASIRKYADYSEGERFSINHEACFGFWRRMATDCGLCLSACPFSHRGS